MIRRWLNTMDKGLAPHWVPLPHSLRKTAHPAVLRAPEHEQMFLTKKKERKIIYGIHKHASTSGKQFILRADGNLADAEGQ